MTLRGSARRSIPYLVAIMSGFLFAYLIVAFFILMAAQRAFGFASALGRLIGAWLIVVALAAIAGAVTAATHQGKPFGLNLEESYDAPPRPAAPDASSQPEPAQAQPEPAPVPQLSPPPPSGE